ncbi:hypothetical protein BRADI_2g40495v3 [Brachypodium distachyon]|uniref:Large ribosomal subunit protein uL2 RNA-binding domain-containing protein n=1 Tax=Brachypodium distachyon TaxID=15368 RepID=A0A0Q3J6H4_BRADI|nr:hypothetical protein BRADI_2g40495v3 [Brachypodium distachyon]
MEQVAPVSHNFVGGEVGPRGRLGVDRIYDRRSRAAGDPSIHFDDLYIFGRIVTIEYEPNRNAYICLIHYGDGEKRYILHPRGVIIGNTIVSSTKVPISMGNALRLSAV